MPNARMIPLIVAIGVCALVGSAEARQNVNQRQQAALDAIEATETEHGITLLTALLNDLRGSGSATLRSEVHLRLGEAFFSLGELDSARMHFTSAVASDPFVEADPIFFNPDMLASYQIARRNTVAVGLRISADTVIEPGSGHWSVQIAVGAPGSVKVAMFRTDPENGDTLSNEVYVGSTGGASISFDPSDSIPIVKRDYRLVGSVERDGERDSTVIDLTVERLQVDTLPHEVQLDTARLLPEQRMEPLNVASFFKGLAFGVVAGALPVAISNRGIGNGYLDVRALGIGGAISIAGVVGLALGRSSIPIQDNIDRNREFRVSWEERNRQVIQENLRRRLWAPIRIRVIGER